MVEQSSPLLLHLPGEEAPRIDSTENRAVQDSQSLPAVLHHTTEQQVHSGPDSIPSNANDSNSSSSMANRKLAGAAAAACEEKRNNQENDENSFFECNICLETVKDPIVTLCGHLFCWSCIYRWLHNNAICPVCKGGVTRENVIPIYGRGTEQKDPRASTDTEIDGVPNRPAAQRPAVQMRTRHHMDISFSSSFGFFPSLFGLQFQQPSRFTSDTQREHIQQAILSRMLLLLGSLVIISLLMF